MISAQLEWITSFVIEKESLLQSFDANDRDRW